MMLPGKMPDNSFNRSANGACLSSASLMLFADVSSPVNPGPSGVWLIWVEIVIES